MALATRRSELLKRALIGSELSVSARAFFALRPNVQLATERLAWFVTEKVLHPAGVPLLHVLLRHGLTDLAAMRARRAYTEEPELQATYYRGLFRSLPALNEVEISGRGEIWDPFNSAPLGTWMRAHRPVTFRDVEPHDAQGEMTPQMFRSSVVMQILTVNDMAEMGQYFPQVLSDSD